MGSRTEYKLFQNCVRRKDMNTEIKNVQTDFKYNIGDTVYMPFSGDNPTVEATTVIGRYRTDDNANVYETEIFNACPEDSIHENELNAYLQLKDNIRFEIEYMARHLVRIKNKIKELQK